jgi:hypothetical protein
MFTKKVKTTWQRDSYPDCGTADREGPHAVALAALDAKTAEMVAEGKMSADTIVAGGNLTLISTRLFTDQAAADEWVAFNNTFATTYGFVKISSEIVSN